MFSLSAVIPGPDCFDAIRASLLRSPRRLLHNSRPDKEVLPRRDFGDFFAGRPTAGSRNRRYTGAAPAIRADQRM